MRNMLGVKSCSGLLLIPIVAFKKRDYLVYFYVSMFIRQDGLEVHDRHRLLRILIDITIVIFSVRQQRRRLLRIVHILINNLSLYLSMLTKASKK